ncbi:hypothetical protein ACSEE7_20390 [Halomonas cupida]|uniref:hypothetical protein n=1 Tax=Halomonas cupida TaxID=44933 RepID=UPI003EF172FC
MEDLFTWLGEALGTLIRVVVDTLGGFFTGLDDAAAGFIDGLSRSLDIAPSFFSLALLVLGLFFLWRALRAILARSAVAALLWALLGLLTLGMLLP